MIRLHVLGPVALDDGTGRELRAVLAQPKRLALLACLTVGPAGFRRRDSLLALLWPELDESRARAALNQAVRFLRRELGPSGGSVILSRGVDEVGVDTSAIWCDASAFRDGVERGDYHEALSLYRGDLLEGFFAEQGAGFQDWLDRERDLLRATAARAARGAAGILERQQNYTPAVAAARRAVELADSDERVMRELLLLLDRLGDRAGALQAYGSFEQRLATEFDARPAAETEALIQRIRARATPAEQDEAATASARAEVNRSWPSHGDPVPAPTSRTATVVASELGAPDVAGAALSNGREATRLRDAPAKPSIVERLVERRWSLLSGAVIGVLVTLLVQQLMRR